MRRRTLKFRGLWVTVLCTAVAVGAGGCRHKPVQALVLPQATPVPLDPVPFPGDLPVVEAPKPKLPPVPVAQAASVPKRQKKRPTKNQAAVSSGSAGGGPAAQPAQAASSPAPEPPQQVAAATGVVSGSSVIGELTPGGDQNPRTQQEAADLIAANEKRLNAVPADVARSQASLLSKVRNFQKQAQQALKAGDAEGARTLATKGKLLLDDLTNPGGE